ncbi:MAG: hypothetical protein WC728_03770 [Elusimicrobiota bacterium]
MSTPISAAELREWLKKERTVEVCGAAFKIRRVPLLFLGDESDDFWELSRQGKDALTQRINALIANPKLPQFRRVMLYGIVEPRLGVGEDEKDAVPVDQVLADYSLAVGLYVEIINLTLESIPKQEA